MSADETPNDEKGLIYIDGHLDLLSLESLGRFIAKTVARHVAGNNMPHPSGDDRLRLPEHVRKRLDNTCRSLANDILNWQAGRLSKLVKEAAGEDPVALMSDAHDVLKDMLGDSEDTAEDNPLIDLLKRFETVVGATKK